MKRISMAVLGCMLGMSGANADFMPGTIAVPNTGGGFVAGPDTIVSVAQVKDMRDDVNVIVQGHIVQHMDDDKYLFKDATDSITVDIDKKDWRGQTVSPSDTVKLYGEVDRGFLSTEIDVDYVEKI